MRTRANSPSSEYDVESGTDWEELYQKLCQRALRQIYEARVPSWRGQEEDLAEDMAQETLWRIIVRERKSQRGEALPIASIDWLAWTILDNYRRDLQRKARRIERLPFALDALDDRLSEFSIVDPEAADPAELLTERNFEELLFQEVAHAIALLPEKQRAAILMDLANRMEVSALSGELTALQRAFQNEGISLWEYKNPASQTGVERARRASLTSIAYKRIAHLFAKQPETLIEELSPASSGTTQQESGIEAPSVEEKRSPNEISDSHVVDECHLQELDRNSEIAAHIGELPERFQKPMRLHYIEGLSYPKVAKQLNQPIGTVKSYVNRGKKLLHRLSEGKGREVAQAMSPDELAKFVAHIGELPERFQKPVRLHYIEGLSYPKVAKQLNQPIGTVKSYVNRGKKLLMEL